jgi:hypothetical protein
MNSSRRSRQTVKERQELIQVLKRLITAIEYCLPYAPKMLYISLYLLNKKAKGILIKVLNDKSSWRSYDKPRKT